MSTKEQIQSIPVDRITDPKFLLRFVNRNSAVYVQLLDSVRQHGLLNSICVRPHPNGEPDLYEAVDGLYRLTICREIGKTHIPAIVQAMSDEEVLASQIRANALRPETTKIEYAKQLRRIQELRPGITMAEMSVLTNQNARWIQNQLDLLELDERTQQLIDDGEMPLRSAYLLAKVPRIYRSPEIIAKACVLPSDQFKELATQIIKGFMEQVRQGRLERRQWQDQPFDPHPYQRGIKKVVAEMNNPAVGPELIVLENLRTPLQGWLAALRWTVNMDPITLKQRRQQYENHRNQPNLKDLYEREPDDLRT